MLLAHAREPVIGDLNHQRNLGKKSWTQWPKPSTQPGGKSCTQHHSWPQYTDSRMFECRTSNLKGPYNSSSFQRSKIILNININIYISKLIRLQVNHVSIITWFSKSMALTISGTNLLFSTAHEYNGSNSKKPHCIQQWTVHCHTHTHTQLHVGISMKTQITILEPTSSRTSLQSRNPWNMPATQFKHHHYTLKTGHQFAETLEIKISQ